MPVIVSAARYCLPPLCPNSETENKMMILELSHCPVCVPTSKSFCFYLLAIYRTLLECALRLCHLLNAQKKDTLPYIWPTLSGLFVPHFSSTVISLYLASTVTAHLARLVMQPELFGFLSLPLFSFMKPNLVLPAPFALGAVRFALVVSKVFVNEPCTDAHCHFSEEETKAFRCLEVQF